MALFLGSSTALTGAFVGEPAHDSGAHASAAVDLRLPEFIDREDPAAWSEHPATDLRYRRTTTFEREANGWNTGTFLVEAPWVRPAQELTSEAIRILVPRDDDAAVALTLAHVRSEWGVPASITEAEGETTVLPTPRFHDYVGTLPARDAADSTILGVTASVTAGLSGYGYDRDRHVTIRGPEASWAIQVLPAPGGDAPSAHIVLVELTQTAGRACGEYVLGMQDGCLVDLPHSAPPPGAAETCASLTDVDEEAERMNVVWAMDCDLDEEWCSNYNYGSTCTTACKSRDISGIHLDDSCRPLTELCLSSDAAAVLRVCWADGTEPRPACDDGVDNDGDGKTDYPDDPGCTSATDTDETDTATGPACNDGVDNDGDQWVDYPDDPGCVSALDTDESNSRTTKRLALMGEIQWCTANKNNWAAGLRVLGDEMEAGFAANGGTIANPFHAYSHCWTAASQSDAEYCDKNSCTDGSGHAYPYSGCDGIADCYLNNAWNDVAHARQHNSDIVALDLAEAIHLTVTTREGSGTRVCGVAYFPPSGASIATNDYSSCRRYVTTHEVGHNFDAEHDNGWCAPAEGQPGVMAYDSGRGNFFCDANRRAINSCMQDTPLDCPRRGTG